jgi:hypothetical protein
MGFFNLFHKDNIFSKLENTSKTAVVNEFDNLSSRLGTWAGVEHNEDGTHNINTLNRPYCLAYSFTVQSITSGVYTPVTFDTNVRDIGGLHSPSFNNTRFVANSDGLWGMIATVNWNPDADAPIIRGKQITIQRNGDNPGVSVAASAPDRAITGSAAFDSTNTSLTCKTFVLFPLFKGDYLEVIAVHNASTAVNTGIAGGNSYSANSVCFFKL